MIKHKFILISIFLMLILLSFSTAYIPDSSLKGFWRMENNVFDSSEEGNNGTLIGGSYVSSKGTNGTGSNALSLDGINDYIFIPDDDSLDGMTKLSITAWVFRNAINQDTVLAKWVGGDSDATYQFLIKVADSKVFTNLDGSAVASGSVESNDTIGIGTWNHVAITYDGSLSSNNVNFYINGILNGSTKTYNGGTLAISSANLTIGIASDLTSNAFNGTVDEIAIFDDVLSASNILDIYNTGIIIEEEEEEPEENITLPVLVTGESIFFEEHFNYNDVFTNHDWTWFQTSGNHPNTPVLPASTNTYAFGFNTTDSGSAATHTVLLHRLLPQDVSNGTMSMTYNLELLRGGSLTDHQITFTNSAGNVELFDVQHGATGGTTIVTNKIGGGNCTATYTLTTPYNIIAINQFDIDNNQYSLFYFINGSVVDIGCSGLVLHGGTMIPFERLYIKEIWTGHENGERYFDDLILSASITTLSAEGEPCTSDDECASGNCEYGVCTKKKGGDGCTSDDQCLSGNCASNGLCVKASLWESIDASKRQQFGDDSNTNNFISLFFMIGLPLLIILSTKSRAGVLGGLAVFIGLGFFFGIVGYLSPFILLGIVIVILISMVFAFMIKGGEG